MLPLVDPAEAGLLAQTVRGTLVLLGAGALFTALLQLKARQPALALGGTGGLAAAAPPKRRYAVVVRFGSALATILLFIFTAYWGGAVFVGFMGLLVAIALHEFWGMLQAAGVMPLKRAGSALGLGVVAAVALLGARALGPAMALSLTALLPCGLREELEGLPVRIGATLFGIAFVALQAACMVLLREGPAGFAQFAFFFAVIQAADAFAFFGGRLFGKRPLAPAVSPGKTWEGCAVGLAAAVGTAGLFSFALPSLPLPAVLGLGAAFFASSLLGDLVASSFKRAAGLKDYGTLLPEQGGILDRFDGYFFSAPLAALLFGLLWP